MEIICPKCSHQRSTSPNCLGILLTLAAFPTLAVDRYDMQVCDSFVGNSEKLKCYQDLGFAKECSNALSCYQNRAEQLLAREESKLNAPVQRPADTHENPDEQPPKKGKPWDHVQAKIACENGIKKQVLAPSDVDIHWLLGSSVRTVPLNHAVVVDIQFDAKNLYGVMLPYVAHCIFLPEDKSGTIKIKPRQ